MISIHPTTYVHPSAIIEGKKITIGKYNRIGAGTIIEGHDIVIGDFNLFFLNISIRGGYLTFGSYINVFDNANIESGRGKDIDRTYIEDECWINHGSVMHGSRIGRGAVIGMNASLNYHTFVGRGAVVMCGSACNVATEVPDNAVFQGVPARLVQSDINDEDRVRLLGLIPQKYIRSHARSNVQLARSAGFADADADAHIERLSR